MTAYRTALEPVTGDVRPATSAASRPADGGSPPETGPWRTGRWRAWLVGHDERGVPRLAGLYGTPWDAPRLEARCVRRAIRIDHGPLARAPATRAHRRIPDLACTCGVHALDPVDDDGLAWRILGRLVPPGVAHVVGAVSAEDPIYPAERLCGIRARRAAAVRIVGPLLVIGPRSTRWHRALRRRPPDRRNLDALAAALAVRYRVPAFVASGNRSIGS